MDFLKGKGVTVAKAEGSNRTIEMVVFADGSTGITCNGSMHSLWEAGEVEDCFRAFLLKAMIRHDATEKLTVLGENTNLEDCQENTPLNVILSKRLPMN